MQSYSNGHNLLYSMGQKNWKSASNSEFYQLTCKKLQSRYKNNMFK